MILIKQCNTIIIILLLRCIVVVLLARCVLERCSNARVTTCALLRMDQSAHSYVIRPPNKSMPAAPNTLHAAGVRGPLVAHYNNAIVGNISFVAAVREVAHCKQCRAARLPLPPPRARRR